MGMRCFPSGTAPPMSIDLFQWSPPLDGTLLYLINNIGSDYSMRVCVCLERRQQECQLMQACTCFHNTYFPLERSQALTQYSESMPKPLLARHGCEIKVWTRRIEIKEENCKSHHKDLRVTTEFLFFASSCNCKHSPNWNPKHLLTNWTIKSPVTRFTHSKGRGQHQNTPRESH